VSRRTRARWRPTFVVESAEDPARIGPPAFTGDATSPPKPIIKEPTDAIVRVTSSGICGSDLHLYEVLGPFTTEETSLVLN